MLLCPLIKKPGKRNEWKATTWSDTRLNVIVEHINSFCPVDMPIIANGILLDDIQARITGHLLLFTVSAG